MSEYVETILFGIVVAWTPSIMVVALLLWQQMPLDE